MYRKLLMKRSAMLVARDERDACDQFRTREQRTPRRACRAYHRAVRHYALRLALIEL